MASIEELLEANNFVLTGDVYKCSDCNNVIENVQATDDIAKRHFELYPLCPSYGNYYRGKCSMYYRSLTEERRRYEKIRSLEYKKFVTLQDEFESEMKKATVIFNKLSANRAKENIKGKVDDLIRMDLMDEEARRNTFGEGNSDLAADGFAIIDGTVKCIYCYFTPKDDQPVTQHFLSSPNCKFVTGEKYTEIRKRYRDEVGRVKKKNHDKLVNHVKIKVANKITYYD